VPFPGMENFNLLKTHDLSQVDRNKLAKAGLGDLLRHPTAEILSSAMIKDQIDLGLEKNDVANRIQIKFVHYKTAIGKLDYVPERFQLRFRFFTFSEYRSGFLGLRYGNDMTTGGIPHLKSNTTYFM